MQTIEKSCHIEEDPHPRTYIDNDADDDADDDKKNSGHQISKHKHDTRQFPYLTYTSNSHVIVLIDFETVLKHSNWQRAI